MKLIATIIVTLIAESIFRITIPRFPSVIDLTTLGIREDASALASAIGTLTLLYGSSLGILIPFAAAVGMGALAVYFLEYWQQQFLLNRISLWVLVLCVFLGLVLKSFLPIPPLLASVSEAALIGVTVGVFWKGRPYWR